MKARVGVRAVTMQQPFASAMVHGAGLFTRRGKPTTSFGEGEWIAVHVGSNSQHLKNDDLMKRVREHWPECPSNEMLLQEQKSLIGIAHFVDGEVLCSSDEVVNDFFIQTYDCTKTYAWKADQARNFDKPLNYPKGQLQLWHINFQGFAGEHPERDAQNLLSLVAEPKGSRKRVSRLFMEGNMDEPKLTKKRLKTEKVVI